MYIIVRELYSTCTVLMEIICLQALQDKTGVTWNKRFKKQFGPITKVRSLLQGSYSMTVNLTYFDT